MAKEAKDDAAKPDEAKTPAAPVDDGLVEVRKGRETLRVHPTCVKDHVAAGWSE